MQGTGHLWWRMTGMLSVLIIGDNRTLEKAKLMLSGAAG